MGSFRELIERIQDNHDTDRHHARRKRSYAPARAGMEVSQHGRERLDADVAQAKRVAARPRRRPRCPGPLYADVLWDKPTRDAPKWSRDQGIVVKRKSNPKEATVEA
jgi:hypothetical protein